MKISVIIPTLNEAANLPNTLHCFNAGHLDIEIIIVDGGSHDQTLTIAQDAGAVIVCTAPGRAHQLNTGAQYATGDAYLFLHADTQLPQNWQHWITQTLQNPHNIAGAFELAIATDRPGIRLVEWGVQVRSRLLQLPYGDQAIFLRAATFQQLGGFPDLRIMEDFQFVKRLQSLGHIAIVPAKVITSGRRWETLGVFRTTLLNQMMILGFYLGIAPERLQIWYRGQVTPTHQRAQSDTLN